jgi:hypothetical protein
MFCQWYSLSRPRLFCYSFLYMNQVPEYLGQVTVHVYNNNVSSQCNEN